MNLRSILTPLAAIALALSAAAVRSSSDGGGARPAARDVSPGVVDAAAARRLVAEGVKVIDVRTPAEYAAGHVPGAVNLPYDEIGRRLEEVGPASAPLLLYCRTGHRSGLAVQTLRAHGYTRLYDLRSYELWLRSEPRPAGK